MKNLEHFRLNEYLGTYLFLNNNKIEDKFEMSFNDYSMHAFYSTSDDLSDLENEKKFINNGKRTLISISLWFLALEAFVNSICKITCLAKSINFKPIAKFDLGTRLTFLITTLKYDEVAIKKTGLYNRINEFKQFRNEVFHDRNLQTPLEFKKTNFSTIPLKSNQVDTFQALLIYLETVLLFRYCIPGLDLMPNISVGNSQVLHFDKLDILYKKYLTRYFEAILNKHDLTTDLKLEISDCTSLEASKIFTKGEIAVMSRIEQAEKFKFPINQTTTQIGRDIYHEIVSDYNLPNGHASNLNFIRDWPSFYVSMKSFAARNSLHL